MDDGLTFASSLTALGVFFIIAMSVLTWSLPRRSALIPLMITTCYMPLGQFFVIGGMHLQFFRILLLVGVCRAWTRREGVGLQVTCLDKLLGFWAVAAVVLGTLADPSSGRLTNRVSEVFNALGLYYVMRCWVRDLEDVLGLVRVLAVLAAPLALSMLVEKFTSRNIFSAFGGVPQITVERDGKLRCQAAFRHPIMAGTYGATLFPLFAGLWLARKEGRHWALLGCCSAIVVTLAAASSGAFMALVSAVIGFGMWKARLQMRWIRRGLILALIGLACLMKAPVWYAIAKLSDLTGGTGWHRSYLIDQALKHLDEWWLFGSDYTAHWAPAGQVLAADHNNMDITNHYIMEGLGGGVCKLGLFMAMIVMGFKTVGQYIRGPDTGWRTDSIFVWSIGVCLLAHCVSFISVAYFDQIIVMWFWLLGILAMLSQQLQVGSNRVQNAESGLEPPEALMTTQDSS